MDCDIAGNKQKGITHKQKHRPLKLQDIFNNFSMIIIIIHPLK